jgi:hypothetical protein
MADIPCHLGGMKTVVSGQWSVVRSGPEPGAQAKPEPQRPDKPAPKPAPKEIGGPPGPEPTRYGDWQYNGRVTDF